MKNTHRRGASLLELLIPLSIIGGLAGLILTAAMMVLNRAMHILD
jgi:type II secretory pathway pseudopilin PulG